jgi:hypothetical protein
VDAPALRRSSLKLKLGVVLCGAMVATAASGTARSDDAAKPPQKDWHFNISPYVWAAGLKGTVATVPGLPPIKVDASFSDVLRNLDLAAMVDLEARYRRFGAYADIMYTKISGDADTSRQIPFDGIDAESGIFIGTFDGLYRALEGDRGFLDLLAGARVWSVDTGVKLHGGILPHRDVDESQSWVDPVIGVKGRFDLGAGFYLNSVGHVGGLGAASDLTWDVFGGVGYQVNDAISLVAGYRHLEVDYQNDEFKFDVEMSGPLIGGTIRF